MITLGAVSYLNAKPLLWGLPCEIIKTIPSQLLPIFESGRVDAALLSLYDILQRPHLKTIADIAIACRGPVYSVILAYEGPLERIKRICLDPASHTSNQLLKIILRKFYQLDVEFVEGTSQESSVFPRVIIGDPAIAFRKQPSCSILDLGEEWYRFTGLPFVFARWAMPLNHPYESQIVQILQEAKERGLQAREAIAATCPHPAFAFNYFTQYIHYGCGVKEEQGIQLFQQYLQS